LDSENATTMINGVAMNKLYDGGHKWGGLNDATRNQEFSIGTAPPIILSEEFLEPKRLIPAYLEWVPESRSQVQIRITVGALEPLLREWVVDGLCCFGRKRLAQEGYFEGTTYDGNSLYQCRKEVKRKSVLILQDFTQIPEGKFSKYG
jgi:hypothetical protein